jgi:hypothetical protein
MLEISPQPYLEALCFFQECFLLPHIEILENAVYVDIYF